MPSTSTNNGFKKNNKLLLLVLLLTVIAALPRLYDLGGLGFYMDEETTAFASRTMAEGMPPQMPSGMPYHRAVIQSFMNALSAKVFGLDNEVSYRLPGTILGILTIPLIFLLARPYVGIPVAFLVALLLALSEWHIFTSRQARMYAPFLFFYIACVFSILRWAQSGKNWYLVASIVLFSTAVSFHKFGIFAAFIPFVALFIQGFAKTQSYKLVIFSAIGGLSASLFGLFYINKPYQLWKTLNGVEIGAMPSLINFSGLPITDYRLAIAAVMVILLGVWLARESSFKNTGNGKYLRITAHYTISILFTGFAATANIHGAFLSLLLFLFLYPGSLPEFLKSSYRPITVIALITTLSTGYVIMDAGLLPGIKSMVMLPHQYWTLLNDLTPGITLLCFVSLIYLALGNKETIGKYPYIIAICALFPLIFVGMIKNWVPARYIIAAYPFILIAASFMLYEIVKKLFSFFNITSGTLPTITSLMIVLSGVLGGHGIMSAYHAATLTYGENSNETAHIFPVHPDHKNTGEYVAAHSNKDDIIIAEDILQQQWYSGRVDYWLRSQESHKMFLYIGRDNMLHDIYVNSIVATREILETLLTRHDKRIWLITSGETYHQRKYYLNDKQQDWLDAIEENNRPVFTGKDNISFVYCLHCEYSQ